jgi:hypothetical protein
MGSSPKLSRAKTVIDHPPPPILWIPVFSLEIAWTSDSGCHDEITVGSIY